MPVPDSANAPLCAVTTYPEIGVMVSPDSVNIPGRALIVFGGTGIRLPAVPVSSTGQK